MGNLIEIRTDNLSNMSEDINRNLRMLADSPTFRGHIGGSGAAGSTVQGVRGNQILILDITKFNSEYNTSYNKSTMSITVINELYAQDVNKLLLSLHIQSLIDGDLIMLFNGMLIRFDGNIWKNTGVRVVTDEESITKSDIMDIIQDNLVAESVMCTYASLDKVVEDSNSNSGDNTTSTDYSIVDISVNASGQAYTIPTHKFIALNEDMFENSDGTYINTTTIIGDPNKYYEIVQRALTDSSGGFKRGGMPAMIVLQDNETGGILFGSDTQSPLSMGHILKHNQSTYIFNKYFKPSDYEYDIATHIELNDNEITLHGKKINLNPLVSGLFINGKYDNLTVGSHVLVRDSAEGEILCNEVVNTLTEANSSQSKIPSTQAVWGKISNLQQQINNLVQV